MNHIALVMPDLETGGAERVMLLLARGFAERGHRVDLVVGNAEGPLHDTVPASVRLIDLGVRTKPGGAAAFAARFVGRLAGYLRRERPDAVLSTVQGANFAAVMARALSGVHPRLVLREAASPAATTSPFRRSLRRLLYPRADALVALTAPMREQLIALGAVPVDGTVVIHNPVDVAGIRAAASAPCPHPWFTDSSGPVLVSVGRLTREKDYPTLLRALARLRETIPARLLIVGEGAERAALEALIGYLGLSAAADLVGFDRNPWRWLARGDVFVLSSTSEGYPNVLREARALAVPVVATEYDASARDLVPDAAAVVRCGDTLALAAALAARLRGGRPKGSVPRPQEDPDALLFRPVDAYLAVLIDGEAVTSRQWSTAEL